MKRAALMSFAVAVAGVFAAESLAQQPPAERGESIGGRGDFGPQPRDGGPRRAGERARSGAPGGPGGDDFGPRDAGPGRRPGQPGTPPERGERGFQPFPPGMGPRGGELSRLERDDPEMHKLVAEDMRLEQACLDLANQVRSAKPDQREKLRSELAVQVNKHFEVRQQRRELQLRRMEEELKRLREAIESRNKGRDEIVERRLLELVGDPKDLEF